VRRGGDELKKAAKNYKKENVRLRTGFATVFPSGKLKYDKVIAAVGPICDSRIDTKYDKQLMRKTIYSILDLFLDHEFSKYISLINLGSVVIPSFCNETSGFPSRDYAKVVIKVDWNKFDVFPK